MHATREPESICGPGAISPHNAYRGHGLSCKNGGTATYDPLKLCGSLDDDLQDVALVLAAREEQEEPVVGEEQEATMAPEVPPTSGRWEHQYAGTPIGEMARQPPPAKG